ncbi:MAG: acyloxyacyl hydrolase [Pseudomonadota bacterium]
MGSQIQFIALCCVAALAGGPAAADGLLSEVRVGGAFHDRGLFSDAEEDGIDVTAEALFASPGFLRWVGKPRPHLGLAAATDAEATSYLHFGLTWQADIFRGVFIEGSLGGAVHDGDPLREEDQTAAQRATQKALGCRVLLRESVGAGYRLTERLNFSVYVDHISNANLCDSNEGLDNIGARLGWRF